ncbi:MAG: hypothetical protein ACREXP_15830 [Steroidobacteraceae bacterium]
MLTQGAAASAAGVLLAGRSAAQGPAEPLSEQNLLDASALSGERLSRQRLQAMKPRLESTLKQLEVLRQFDADETEPLPMVQL